MSTAIKEVRRVVGDTGKDQHTIRTVHGRGFQFVAPIIGEKPASVRKGPTIAILPFRSLSPKAEDKFIADGFSEEIIANLTRFHDLRVLSHMTTIHLRKAGHADILAEIGHCYAFLGNFEKAIPMLDKAIALSPIHPGWYHYLHAWRFALGDFSQAALLEIEKVPMPGFAWYYAHQVWFHSELGNADAAQHAKQELLSVYPDFEANFRNEMVLRYFTGPLIEKAYEGWRKAGLQMAPLRRENR